MTFRQSALKAVYPVLMEAGKWFGIKAAMEENANLVKAVTPFYELKATANNGNEIDFYEFKGKKVLLVNTASDCGYTSQYKELEILHEMHKDKLVIVGFPANDFQEQEKKSDKQIAEFCSTTFGVQFLLMKKSVVVKNENQNEVFKWLTDKNQNGWNDKAPEWNFSKYLVSDEGELLSYFGPAVSPLDEKVIKMIKQDILAAQ